MRQLAVDLDESRIDTVFREIESCHLPGVAAGIAVGGAPLYRKAFGLANVELPLALSPTMRLRIGSATKTFTALAYLLLCERGHAHVDDPVGRYLPELHRVAHAVTARQLLGHVSGLRDVHDVIYQFSGFGRGVSSEEILSLYRDIDDRNERPGVAWNYNNGGYLILSAVLERILGQPLETILRDLIFAPLGMRDTLLHRCDSDFVSNSATLHHRWPHGRFSRTTLGTALAGEGGIVSTVDDMLRWLTNMAAPVVGSSETWAQIKTPQRLSNGDSTGYGLGLYVGCYRGVEMLSHPGSVLGGSAQVLKIPAAQLDVVILTNRGDVSASELADRVLDRCLTGVDEARTPDVDAAHEARGPRTFQSEDRAPCPGTYRSVTTRTEARILDDEGAPALHSLGRFGRMVYRLDSLGDRRWRAHSDAAPFLGGVLEFDRNGTEFRFSSERNRGLLFRRDS